MKKTITTTTLSVFLMAGNACAQYIGVLANYSLNPNGNDIVRDIRATDEDTKITVGSYQPVNITSTYNGFIESDQVDNNYDWRVIVAGSGNDEINAVDINVVTDGVNFYEEIYVTGYFTGSVTFTRYKWYPTTQVDVVHTISSPGGNDAAYFVAKLDHNGNVLWIQISGNNAEVYGEIGNDVDVCVVGSQVQVYTTGIYRGNPYFYQGGSPLIQLNASSGWTSVFTAKYIDYGGTAALSWVKKVNDDADSQHDYGYGVCGDGSGNVYMCGSIGGTTTLIPGSPMSVEGNDDAVVVKYNSAGTVGWNKDFGAGGTIQTPSDQARCITFRDNTLHVSGYFNGSSMLWPSSSNTSIDAFLIKMVPSGVIMWRDVVNNLTGADIAYKHSYSEDGSRIFLVGQMTGDAWIQSSSGPPSRQIHSPNGGAFSNGFFAVVATSNGAYVDDEWIGCDDNTSVITTVETCHDDNVLFGGAFKDHYLYESGGVCVVANTNPSAFINDGFTGVYLLDPFLAPAPVSAEETVADQSATMQLHAFPNPTRNSVTITKRTDAAAHIDVLDISGRTVIERSLMNGMQASVDLSFLETGVYLVRVTEGNYSDIIRVLKE